MLHDIFMVCSIQSTGAQSKDNSVEIYGTQTFSLMTSEIYPDCLQSLLKWSKILSLFLTYLLKRYYIKTEWSARVIFFKAFQIE